MNSSAAQAFASRYLAALIECIPLEKQVYPTRNTLRVIRALLSMRKRFLTEADLLEHLQTPHRI